MQTNPIETLDSKRRRVIDTCSEISSKLVTISRIANDRSGKTDGVHCIAEQIETECRALTNELHDLHILGRIEPLVIERDRHIRSIRKDIEENPWRWNGATETITAFLDQLALQADPKPAASKPRSAKRRKAA